MEIEEGKWQHQAHENIDKYLHRGGDGKGNEPQLLYGSNLHNTIGIAMGLPLRDPTLFSHEEFELAEKGELVFFDSESLKAIHIVDFGIRVACNGDSKVYLTVVPIELYYENKLYEVPVFKVHRYHHSKIYYVDNIGRHYDSFDDWKNNNKLPPCKIIYPQNLELTSDGQHTLVSPPYEPPSAQTETKVLHGIDIAAGILGIGSAIGLMVVSGPAAPFLAIVGIASAIWGTSRAIHDLVDRGEHGQSIDPFTDSTARMLWLGIAASIASFGAMGATMRLSSLVARGIQVSNALKILTNVVNGVSITLNSAAIVNNSIYLIQHIHEMSLADILLNVALLAFWTKGTFTFKRSSVIISEAHDRAFASISQELPPETRSYFSEFRSRVQEMLSIDEIELLQLFKRASESNISIRECAAFLIDGMHYYDTVPKLTSDQIESLSSLRDFIQDDLQLLHGLQRVSTAAGSDREQTLRLVLELWDRYVISNRPNTDDAHFIPGYIVLGHAPPIEITQLENLSPSLIRFVGEHLSTIHTDAIHEWSITELASLQNRGLFIECPVTGIKDGYATVSLKGCLDISLRKLDSFPEDTCLTILRMIGRLSEEQTSSSSKLPSEVVKTCVSKNRLRFEVHRKESVEWALQSVARYPELTEIINSDLMPHERDRLYTFKTEASAKEVESINKTPYMDQMMDFVHEMNPKNVSELVAYSEFVMTYVDEKIALLEKDIRDGKEILPHNMKKKPWLRKKAVEKAFTNVQEMRDKFTELMTIVEENDMAGIQIVDKGLSDEALVSAIRSHRIRFGGKVSAAYHIYKHSTDPTSAYIEQANQTIGNSEYHVSLGQEGDSRIIMFNDPDGGNAVVLEKDGRVLLCSFRAGGRK
ncbi:uncharacterized protein LOC125063069 [Pieris napi]|uniref:uncharacterized protein LOC125063069 n=1 Tax=Pieris napi TaxID=78633 RepID=UPI001FB8778A|nr:uncharacterized protein LOC125063069 [Pieris napi]